MPPPIPNSLNFNENVKKIRVLRNGAYHFQGVLLTVRPWKYLTLDSLLEDAAKGMKNRVYIPNNGFNSIFKLDGTRIKDIEDIEDGSCYTCSGLGEPFKKIEFNTSIKHQSLSKDVVVCPRTSKVRCDPDTFPTRLITIIRNGPRPRRIFQHLLNNRNARSLEQALTSITRLIKLDSGAVRKVFNQAAYQITSLEDLFGYHHVFFAYGHEVAYYEDFVLDRTECNALHYNVLFRSSNASPVCKRLSLLRLRSATACLQGSTTNIPRQITISYDIGKVIGEGGFGIVRECVSKGYRQNGTKYAMKIINKSKCSKSELENEVTLLSRLNHPNIMRVFNAYDSPTHLYLVMELMEGGDLSNVIDAGKTPEKQATRMTQNIASALFYLHSLLIVHRDVKPDNFLIGVDKCGNKVLKLSDFGFATSVTKTHFKGSGTPFYMAPERLREEHYDYKVDTWAAGVTVYLLLTSEFPFSGDGDECYKNIRHGAYNKISPSWRALSKDARDIIGGMLQVNPENRFSAEDILEHPWLSHEVMKNKY